MTTTKTTTVRKQAATVKSTPVQVAPVSKTFIDVSVPIRKGRPEWPSSSFQNLFGKFKDSKPKQDGFKNIGILFTQVGMTDDDNNFFPICGLQHFVQTNEEKNQIRLIGPNNRLTFFEDFDEVEDGKVEEQQGTWNTCWIGNRSSLVATVRYMLKTGKGVVPIREADRLISDQVSWATGTRGRYSPFYSGFLKDRENNKIAAAVNLVED